MVKVGESAGRYAEASFAFPQLCESDSKSIVTADSILTRVAARDSGSRQRREEQSLGPDLDERSERSDVVRSEVAL